MFFISETTLQCEKNKTNHDCGHSHGIIIRIRINKNNNKLCTISTTTVNIKTTFFFPRTSYLRSFMRFKSRLVEKWRWCRWRRTGGGGPVAEDRLGQQQWWW